MKAGYHFCTIYLKNKTHNTFKEKPFVIRRVKTKEVLEVKDSFSFKKYRQLVGKLAAYIF
jgi:hypothetical protein